MTTESHFVLRSADADDNNGGNEANAATNQVQEKELPTGVWTPWAEIKCVECVDTSHPMWKGDVDAIREVRPREQFEAAAVCDKCGAEIWVAEEIAHEQRLTKALVKNGIPARMQQTGGMCSAVEVWNSDETAYAMATEVGEGETVGPVYCVGLYRGDMENGFDDGEYWDALTFEGAQERIAKIWRSFQN